MTALVCSSDAMQTLLILAGVEMEPVEDLPRSTDPEWVAELIARGYVEADGQNMALSETADVALTTLLEAQSTVACERITAERLERFAYYVGARSVVEHIAIEGEQRLEQILIEEFAGRLAGRMSLPEANDQTRSKRTLSATELLAQIDALHETDGPSASANPFEGIPDLKACLRLRASVVRESTLSSLELCIIDSPSAGLWLLEEIKGFEQADQLFELSPASCEEITQVVLELILTT